MCMGKTAKDLVFSELEIHKNFFTPLYSEAVASSILQIYVIILFCHLIGHSNREVEEKRKLWWNSWSRSHEGEKKTTWFLWR